VRERPTLDNEGDLRGIELQFRIIVRVPVYLDCWQVFDGIVEMVLDSVPNRLLIGSEEGGDCPAVQRISKATTPDD
jgi:hypothetical protein